MFVDSSEKQGRVLFRIPFQHRIDHIIDFFIINEGGGIAVNSFQTDAQNLQLTIQQIQEKLPLRCRITVQTYGNVGLFGFFRQFCSQLFRYGCCPGGNGFFGFRT